MKWNRKYNYRATENIILLDAKGD